MGGLTQAEFEKEPYMTPFNWFVTDTIETMNTRYLAWIVRCSPPLFPPVAKRHAHLLSRQEPPAAVKEVKQKGAKEKSWDYKPDLRNSPGNDPLVRWSTHTHTTNDAHPTCWDVRACAFQKR